MFLVTTNCHSPGKKNEKKMKIPAGPTCQPPFPSLLLVLLGAAACVATAGVHTGFRATCHRRDPCRLFPLPSPFSLSASSPGPVPLQTLTPLHHWCRRRAPVAALGEPRANSSHGKLLIPLLLRFWPSPGPLSLPAGPPASATVRRRLCSL